MKYYITSDYGGGRLFFWKIYPIKKILCQCHVWHAPKWLMYILNNYAITSARPEVRGTADVGWRSLNPLPINPPRTHSRLYHHMCLRTDGRWRTWMEYLISVSSWRGRCVAHHFNAVCGDVACMRGPRPATSFGPQHELPPARLVIHRTDLCPWTT